MSLTVFSKNNINIILSLDIICSAKLTVFLGLHSQETVRFLEQIMSADKYPSIFSRQMEAIVYLTCTLKLKMLREKKLGELLAAISNLLYHS